ncbi:MAG: hypothetical protein R3277_02440 [Brumimicrobium sp.]|nr:hypothetical protein [Brumimicrobium sp.]
MAAILNTSLKLLSVSILLLLLFTSVKIEKTIIEQLNDNESFEIIMESNGCFHSTTDKLSIKKKKGVYTAIKGKRKKTLGEKDLAEIRDFEIKLRTFDEKMNVCTTTDTYLLKYRSYEFKYVDGTCAWNGMSHLIEKLFSN